MTVIVRVEEGNTLKEGDIDIHFSSDTNYIDRYIIIDL